MFKQLAQIRIIYVLSLGMMLAMFALNYSDLPPQMPLFYSLPESENQIVPMSYIVLIPILETVLLVCNMFLRSLWFKDSKLMSDLIMWTNYIICIFMTYIFIKIISLVS